MVSLLAIALVAWFLRGAGLQEQVATSLLDMPFGSFRDLSASAHVEEDRVLRPALVHSPADMIESIEI